MLQTLASCFSPLGGRAYASSLFNSLALCRGWWQHLPLLLSPDFFSETSALWEPAICHSSYPGRLSSPQNPPVFSRLSSSPVQMYTAMFSSYVGTGNPKPGPQACIVNSVNTVHLPGSQDILLFSFLLFGPCLITPIQPFEVHWTDLGLQQKPIGARVMMKKAWMVPTTLWL